MHIEEPDRASIESYLSDLRKEQALFDKDSGDYRKFALLIKNAESLRHGILLMERGRVPDPSPTHGKIVKLRRNTGMQERIQGMLYSYPDRSRYSMAKEIGISPQLMDYYVHKLDVKFGKSYIPQGRPRRCVVCGQRPREAYHNIVCASGSCVDVFNEAVSCQPDDAQQQLLTYKYTSKTLKHTPESTVICTRSKNILYYYRDLRDHVKYHAYARGDTKTPVAAYAKEMTKNLYY